jgi:hypothetical protein
MTPPLGTYSFLPWLRSGLANQITSADMDPGVKVRAEVAVKLKVSGEGPAGTMTEPVSRNVALYGPGDIVGIERRAIVRVEPRDWITNFEPNYVAHVEFYDEDFPWRYTPAAPDTVRGRMRPWIALIVLAEDEFTDGSAGGRPLPFIDVPNPAVFPPAAQLWAWAHIHVNRSLAASDAEFTSTDMAAVMPRLAAVLNENPDLAYARIMSPRKLEENAAYHAFLMPVFETGRLAGLGLDVAATPHATHAAWDAYPAGVKADAQSYPYYHRWFFRTGVTGDFESLVRLLVPKPVDKRVGTRAMDVQAPGSNLPPISDAELKGILKLGGALKVPRSLFTAEELAILDAYENWDEPYPHDFQVALAKLINLADDYAARAAADANAASGLGDEVEDDPDPLIVPPLYGTWHALTKRLLTDRSGASLSNNHNWLHELNLDPRHRVAAGFGTRVVQDGQESYMDAAWGQIGRVLEANRRIRLGQFAKEVSFAWYEQELVPVASSNVQTGLLLTAPVARRVVADGATVYHRLRSSHVQPALASGAFRRVVRPNGRLVRNLPLDDRPGPDALIERVNDGKVSPAPPVPTPSEITTIDDVADAITHESVPGWVAALLRSVPGLRWIVAGLLLLLGLVALLLFPVVVGVVAVIIFALFAAGAFWLLTTWGRVVAAADTIRDDVRDAGAVDGLPKSPDFHITEPGSGFVPTIGVSDSIEAARLKDALRETDTLLAAGAAAATVPPALHLDLAATVGSVVEAINPQTTIPNRVIAGVVLPPRIREEIGDGFVEAMAYPEFNAPMYEPLKNLSAELFLPNINLVEQNSITLLETNQDFIESYMVGLNHEFARELLWREYPTDQRGSYFRQFWDVSSFFNTDNLDDATLKEKLRDIPPIHTWPASSTLGSHDNREQEGEEEEEIVLVIRGELLKRYPTAVIYAHRACWQRKGVTEDQHPCEGDGQIDNTRERRLTPLSEGEEANPPTSKVRTPLYEAKVDPDIYFFGFDLKVEEAQGGTGENPKDDPGWFFVIKERPGEPRFGLDINAQPQLNVWSDLAWADVQPGQPGSFIEITDAMPSKDLVIPSDPEVSEKLPQYEDDKHIAWNKDMTSADLAYVLFQAPVLVAVHAAEMLGRGGS